MISARSGWCCAEVPPPLGEGRIHDAMLGKEGGGRKKEVQCSSQNKNSSAGGLGENIYLEREAKLACDF